jgi:hypothetical protein
VAPSAPTTRSLPERRSGAKLSFAAIAERARAIAVALVGALDHVAAHFDEMDKVTRDARKQYFSDLYDNSPVVQEHLRKYWRWYGPGLREHYGLPRQGPGGT